MVNNTEPKDISKVIIIIMTIIGLCYIFQAFLTALLLALIFSIVTYPLMKKMTTIKSTKLKALIISFLVLLVFALPFSLLFSFGANESLSFLNNIKLEDYLLSKDIHNHPVVKTSLSFLSISQSDFVKLSNQTISDIKISLISKIQILIYQIPIMLFNFSLMISAIYFMLISNNQSKKILYRNYLYNSNIGQVLVKTFTKTSWAIVMATLGSAIIQTTVVAIPTALVNFNNILLVSFAIFIFSMIPIIGTVPVIAGLFFYHLSLNQYGLAFMYVGIGFLIGFIDSLLKAFILQRTVRINPFIALLSTFAGIHAFGIFGLILGPVIIITLLKLLLYTLKHKSSK